MAKQSGGIKASNKGNNYVSGTESLALFNGDPDEWYDWDGEGLL